MLDSDSEVNIITLAYIVKLGLRPKFTNVNIQKIDNLALETHSMILASCSLQDS